MVIDTMLYMIHFTLNIVLIIVESNSVGFSMLYDGMLSKKRWFSTLYDSMLSYSIKNKHYMIQWQSMQRYIIQYLNVSYNVCFDRYMIACIK